MEKESNTALKKLAARTRASTKHQRARSRIQIRKDCALPKAAKKMMKVPRPWREERNNMNRFLTGPLAMRVSTSKHREWVITSWKGLNCKRAPSEGASSASDPMILIVQNFHPVSYNTWNNHAAVCVRILWADVPQGKEELLLLLKGELSFPERRTSPSSFSPSTAPPLSQFPQGRQRKFHGYKG